MLLKPLLVGVLLVVFAPDANSSITNAIECAGCEAAVEAFRFVYAKNATRDVIMNVAAYVCEHYVKVETLVCRGLATQYREEILYVLGQLIFSPKYLCGLIVPECGKKYNPLGNWTIDLPPKPKNITYPTYPVTRQDNLRVLQLTDIHIDPNYTPGSVANCETYICCHANSVLNGTEKVEAGHWGSLASCDMPFYTVDKMLQHINKTEKLDYIIISGDYVAHSNWEYAKDQHLKVVGNLSKTVESYFPNTPIFWALGNHDTVPVNSFAPHYVPEQYQPRWMYDQLWDWERRWIPANQKNSIQYRGSYITQIAGGLRVLSLNTGYCETTNFWIYINETDPDGTMSWLATELSRAEAEGQYVQIIAHIPPGNDECLEGWSKNYYNIVNRFAKTIVGQFFGHIHVDSFTVFYEDMNDDASTPTSFLFAAPSVTTYEKLNPAYRIYEIRPGNKFEILDYSTYYLNISDTNGTEELQWQLLYKAKDAYGLKEITAVEMDKLVDRISLDNGLEKSFLRNTFRRDDYVCDDKCRFKTLCTLKRGHHNDELCSHLSGYELNAMKSDNLGLDYQLVQQSENAVNELAQRAHQYYEDAKTTLRKKLFGWFKR